MIMDSKSIHDGCWAWVIEMLIRARDAIQGLTQKHVQLDGIEAVEIAKVTAKARGAAATTEIRDINNHAIKADELAHASMKFRDTGDQQASMDLAHEAYEASVSAVTAAVAAMSLRVRAAHNAACAAAVPKNDIDEDSVGDAAEREPENKEGDEGDGSSEDDCNCDATLDDFPFNNFETNRDMMNRTSLNEEALLIRSEIEGISKPIRLGINVCGKQYIDVPPMGMEERLIRIAATGNKNWRRALVNMAGKLATKHCYCTGDRDIGDICHWKKNGDLDGDDLPSIQVPPPIGAQDGMEIAFPDNMVVFSRTHEVVCKFLEGCGLKRTMPVGQEASRFSIKRLPNVSVELNTLQKDETTGVWGDAKVTNHKYKVALADVGRIKVGFILEMLDLTSKCTVEMMNRSAVLHEKHLAAIKAETLPDYNDFLSLPILGRGWTIWAKQPGLCPTDFIPTLLAGSQVKFYDIDITSDVAGTLHAPNFEKSIKKNNGEIDNTHRCGRNTVKQKPKQEMLFRDKGVNHVMLTGTTAYNKVCETITSPGIMEDEPGQKLNFLANPSTKSLKERFRDPIMYRVGITRLETRHGFPPLNSDGISYNQGSLVPAACVPTYEEVLNEHKQHRQLLIQDWKNNLRQCSIEEHLLQIESRISHALGVYIPAMGVFKSNAVKQKTMSQKRANGQPDGCMIYFHNSLTSKCTGTMINSTFNKNGSIIEDGCKTVARVAVWGTPVGKRNLLYVLVAGPGACIENSFNEKKIRPGFDIMRNCWFRPFHIDEDQSTISTAVVQKSIVNSPRMMWPPAKNGQYKGRTYRKYAACDANMTCVGVDNSKLHHLKLGIMRKDIFPDYRKMGGFNMKLTPKSMQGGPLGRCDTRWNEVVTESIAVSEADAPKGVGNTQLNTLGYEYNIVSSFWIGSTAGGEKSKPKATLRLLVGGDVYAVQHRPNALIARLKETCARRVLQVRRTDSEVGMEWKLELDTVKGKIYYSSTDETADLPNSCTSIPANVWLPILEYREGVSKKNKARNITVELDTDETQANLDPKRYKRYNLPNSIGKSVVSYARDSDTTISELHNQGTHELRREGINLTKVKCPGETNSSKEPLISIRENGSVVVTNHETGNKRARV